MTNQRANEIISSPNMIDVTLNGEQVYLEKVNEVNNTVTIHFLNQPDNRQEVSLNNLIEH